MATEHDDLDPRLADAIAGLRNREPETDLWPEIAPRLAPRAVPGTVRVRWPTAIAAGLVIALGSAAGTFAVLRHRLAETPLAVSGATSGAPSTPVAFSPADATLERAIEQLEVTLRSLQNRLDPESRQSLNRSLRLLDQAIADAQQQRRAEPDDPRAARYLTATLRKKLDVLRTVTVMASART